MIGMRNQKPAKGRVFTIREGRLLSKPFDDPPAEGTADPWWFVARDGTLLATNQKLWIPRVGRAFRPEQVALTFKVTI